MNHPFPDIETSINDGGDCTFDQTYRIVLQHFVVAHVQTERRKSFQVSLQGRREWIGRVMSGQVGFNKSSHLRLREIGIR